MPYDAPTDVITRANNSLGGEAPRADIDVKIGDTWFGIGHDLYETGSVDRILEKWGKRGISFAGSMSVTLTNRDQEYSPANSDSAFNQLLGKEAAVYLFFLTKMPPSPVISETTYLSDSLYIGESTTERIPIFTGRIETVTINSDRSVTIEIRDALQDVVNSIFASTGRWEGVNAADAIKYLLDLTGVTVNTAAYERLHRELIGTNVRFIFESGASVVEKLQDIHKAFGTSCIVDEDGEVVMTRISPLIGQFALRSYLESVLFSGDKADVDNRNLMSIASNILKKNIINRVVFTYNDWGSFPKTDAEVGVISPTTTTIATIDQDSIDEWFLLELPPISTSIYLPVGSAWIWPHRLVERYKQPRRLYDAESSLKNGIVAQVADHVDLTDPTVSEDRMGAIITRVGKNPNAAEVGLRIEDFDRESGIKWGFAGAEAVPPDGTRPSGKIDFAFNRSFEIAKDPGTDDEPTYWSSISGSGATFERSSDEARTGQYSARLQATAGSKIWGQPINQGTEIAAGKMYAISVWVKGAVSSGSVIVRLEDDSAVAMSNAISIPAATYSVWTLFTAYVYISTSDDPWKIIVDANGATCDLYLDDIQIDGPFVIPNGDFEDGSVGSVPTSWTEIITTGTFSFRKDNSDSYHLNNCLKLDAPAINDEGYGWAIFSRKLGVGEHTIKIWYKGDWKSNVQVKIGPNLTTQWSGLTIPPASSGSWLSVTFPVIITEERSQVPVYIRIIHTATPAINSYMLLDLLTVDDDLYDFQANWKRYAYAGSAEGQPNPGFDLKPGNANGEINTGILENVEDLVRAF